MFIFVQEHWLPDYATNNMLSKDFSNYRFSTTSSDMFTSPEDKLLESGPTWHGTAVGWVEDVEDKISRLPIISERFCGVKFSDKITNTYWSLI